MSDIQLKAILDLVTAVKAGRSYIRVVKKQMLAKSEAAKSRSDVEAARVGLKGVMADLKRVEDALRAIEGIPVADTFRIDKTMVCASCGDPTPVCSCKHPVPVSAAELPSKESLA